MAGSFADRIETASLGTIHWVAIALVLATGLIHVYAGVVEGRIPVLLAGLGFLGAVGLFLVDFRRRLLYLVGAVYTGIQVPLWYVVKAGEYATYGYVDKAIQVVLVVVLVYLYWQERKMSAGPMGSPTA